MRRSASGSTSGALEGEQDVGANLGCVVERLDAPAHAPPTGPCRNREWPRTGREQKIVVRDRFSARDCHPLADGVDSGDLAQQYPAAFVWSFKMARIGCAMSAGDKLAVAT
ncbi:MAG: hypothetical protein WDN08_11485 [Rhizomicrobium sp.]